MVDHVAALIHQVTVAVLTDADVVDRCGQLLEAQIYRKPTAAAAVPRHSADDRDDPRVVAVKDRLYMRRADVAMPQAPGRGQVKGEVAQYVRFWRAARLGPAVQQTAAFVVSRDGCDLGPGCQKGIQKCVPHRRFTVKLFQHDADGAVHRVDVVIHRACDLADDLGTVRARALHNSTAVAAQKQRGAEDQRRHGHAGDQRCRQDYGAGRALHGRASPAARARRSATGDVPLYFLKQ